MVKILKNGQKPYPISEQISLKPDPFGTAPTFLAYVKRGTPCLNYLIFVEMRLVNFEIAHRTELYGHWVI